MTMRTHRGSTVGLTAMALAVAGLAASAKSDNQPTTKPPLQGNSSPKPSPTPTPAATDSTWDTIAESFGGSKADTRPSRDVTMQFPSATEVREVKAVGGQRVRKGDLLIRARDNDVLAAIAAQKDMAENVLEILGTEKQAELAKFKLDRIRGSGQYSPTEFEEARIGAEVARVQADQAKRHKVQEELKLKQAEASYERYRLEAPFDGIIEEIMVEVGEGVTEQTKVLRMVNIEKLWLDPYAATADTIRLNLKEGSPAWVLVEMPDAPRLVKGKVLYVSPVADSVSQTRRVRVEIDNPQTWPAGTQARVRFTEPDAQWDKYKTTPTTAANPTDPSERALSASSGAFLPSAPEGLQSLAVGASPQNAAATSAEPSRVRIFTVRNYLDAQAVQEHMFARTGPWMVLSDDIVQVLPEVTDSPAPLMVGGDWSLGHIAIDWPPTSAGNEMQSMHVVGRWVDGDLSARIGGSPSERAPSASSGASLPSAPEGLQSLAVGVSPRNTPATPSEPQRGDTAPLDFRVMPAIPAGARGQLSWYGWDGVATDSPIGDPSK